MPAEQKAGNDYSDEAASKGSKDEQQKLAAVAALYSRRNKIYQTFVQRVQKCLVNVKKDETEMRERLRKEANPFADKEKENSDPKDIQIC